MNRRRHIALKFVVLDVLAAIVVFNLVAMLRARPMLEHLLITPLLAPIGMLMLAVHLIDGYKARTDMLSVDYTRQHTIAVIGAR